MAIKTLLSVLAIKRFALKAAKLSKFGIAPALRKIASAKRKFTAKEVFRKQREPDGRKWKPIKKKKVKKGDVHFIGIDQREGSKRRGKQVIRKITSRREAGIINRREGRGRTKKALFRPRPSKGFPKVTRLRDAYVKVTATGSLGNKRIGKTSMTIGSIWKNIAKPMQRGVPSRNIPGRPFWYWTDKEVIKAEVIIKDEYEKILQNVMKKAAGQFPKKRRF